MQTGILGHTGYYSDAKQSPGKHNALISPKTIHSGAFMVEMSYVSGGTVLEAILGSFEDKKASPQKGGFFF